MDGRDQPVKGNNMVDTTSAGIRRHRLLLRLTLVALLLYLLSRLALWLTSLPLYIRAVTTLSVPDIRSGAGEVLLSNAIVKERAASVGLGLQGYVWLSIVVAVIVIGVNWLIGGLILWRNRDSWFAVLTAVVLMGTGSSPMREPLQIVGRGGIWLEIGAAIWPLFFFWLYLFPNGRSIPRWTSWLAYSLTALTVVLFIVPVLPGLEQSPDLLGALDTASTITAIALLALALASQVFRYRRVSGPLERQQAKWFVLGVGFLALFFALNAMVPALMPVTRLLGDLVLVVLPIAVGIAILRYRLWDIDVIIRRTTSYAIITGLLALVYLGSVVVLQRLFGDLTGQNSTAAVVLSTLLIAALFLPVRRRVQDLIDRRFNRTRYNAEKTLERFAATARDETDLDALLAELQRVIQETMQPESVSIWLREPGTGFQEGVGRLLDDSNH